jgi:hypothetical protein
VDQHHVQGEAQASWDSTPPSLPALSPGPLPQASHFLPLKCPEHAPKKDFEQLFLFDMEIQHMGFSEIQLSKFSLIVQMFKNPLNN